MPQRHTQNIKDRLAINKQLLKDINHKSKSSDWISYVPLKTKDYTVRKQLFWDLKQMDGIDGNK